MKTKQLFGTMSLLAVTALGAASAQGTAQPDVAGPAAVQTDGATPVSATGKPLEMQSKEGFWGHVNPFARKKWVHRQIDPIKDRANELDQLQAKNASDIKDVDGRATAGIGRAMDAAHTADAHAADAQGRADRANSLALSADGKTTSLNGTVQNLDQFSEVSSTSLPFLKGRTALTTKQKANLDTVADTLAAQKGYIVEVQGYSRAGVANSQSMADSVVRYLVTAHQVPVYRIYRTGLGKATQTASAGNDKPLVNGVRVTVLHNSLATMDTAGATPTTPGSN